MGLAPHAEQGHRQLDYRQLDYRQQRGRSARGAPRKDKTMTNEQTLALVRILDAIRLEIRAHACRRDHQTEEAYGLERQAHESAVDAITTAQAALEREAL